MNVVHLHCYCYNGHVILEYKLLSLSANIMLYVIYLTLTKLCVHLTAVALKLGVSRAGVQIDASCVNFTYCETKIIDIKKHNNDAIMVFTQNLFLYSIIGVAFLCI